MKRATIVTLGLVGLLGCGPKTHGPDRPVFPAVKPEPEVAAPFLDPSVDQYERCRRMLANARPGDADVVRGLIYTMKDVSQTAFLLFDDPQAKLGYRVEENKFSGADTRANQRATAVMALEKCGTTLALPDLLLALDDRESLVSVHAAHALLKLGSRAGIPTLIAALDKKAYVNEHANRFLKEASGQDFGFDSDVGLTRRAEAVERWRAWWETFKASGKKLNGEGAPYAIGQDAQTDRRIRRHVELVGEFQFLFMEQGRKMLQRLGPAAVPFVVEGLEKSRSPDNPTWRGGLAQVLGQIATPESRGLVRSLIADPNAAVRSRAAIAAGELGGDLVPALKSCLADGDASVVIAAVRGLARNGSPADAPSLDALRARKEPEVARAVDLARVWLTRSSADFDMAARYLFDASVIARTEAIDALNAMSGRIVIQDPDLPEGERRAAEAEYRKALTQGK